MIRKLLIITAILGGMVHGVYNRTQLAGVHEGVRETGIKANTSGYVENEKGEVEFVGEITPTEDEIIKYILEVFKDESAHTKAKFIYVISKESGFKIDAMNWNCRYGNKSTSCKPQDRDYAWSVDCGVMMLNHLGKYCPGNVMPYKQNIQLGYEKFKQQGMKAWVASWDLE